MSINKQKVYFILRWVAVLICISSISIHSQNTESLKQTLINRITQNPEDVNAYILLARIYYNSHNYGDAESTLKIALDMRRNNAEAYYLLGLVYTENSAASQNAINAFKNAVKHKPRYPKAYQELAEVYRKTRRYQNLIDDFQEFNKKQPDNLLFDFYLGEAYFHINQYELARQYLKNALPEEQFMVRIHYYLGLIYFRESNYEEAINHFEKIEDTTTFESVRQQYNQAKKIQELLHCGERAFEQKEWTVAIRNFEAIIKSDQTLQIAMKKLEQAQYHHYFSRGKDSERQQNYAAALMNYRTAARYALPGDESAQVSQAIGRIQGKRELTGRIDGFEEKADAQLLIHSTKSLDDAKENLKTVLKLDPKRKGVREKIWKAYRLLIAPEKNNPELWNDAIVHLIEAQNYAHEDSIAKIKTEITLIQQKQIRASQIKLAKNLLQNKNWDGAFHIFAGIYQADTTQKDLLREMIVIGDSLRKNKQPAEALDVFQKIQAIAPAYSLARQRIADLEDEIAWTTQAGIFLKKYYGRFIYPLVLILFLSIVWRFYPGPLGRFLQFFRLKTAASVLYDRHLKQRVGDDNPKNADYFLRLGRIYQQAKEDEKLLRLAGFCQDKVKQAKNIKTKTIWILTFSDLLVFQNHLAEAIEVLEDAYHDVENELIHKKLLQVYKIQLERTPGNNALHNRLAELYLDVKEYAAARRHLEISRQDRNENIREKAERLLRKLQGMQAFARSLFDWCRDFFKESGFEIVEDSEEPEHCYLIVKSEDYKQYGNIRVNMFKNGTVDGNRIQAFYQEIQQQQPDLTNRIAFCVVTEQVTADARMQIFTYQLNPGFGIILFSYQELRRAVIERKCRQELEERIRTHTGQVNFYIKKTPVTSPLDFFGRNQVINELKSRIDSFDPVGVYGLRKVGKSSLIQYLKEQLPEPVAFLDLQTESGHANCAVLYHKIIREFVNDLKIKFPGNIDVSTLQCLLPGIDPAQLTGEDFANDLSRLSRILKQRSYRTSKLILFMDEIEELLPSNEKNEKPFQGYLEFLKVLRGLNQDKKLLIPVVSSVDSRFNQGRFADGKENPAYTMFVEFRLAGLSREDSDDLITTIGASLGLKYEENALKMIYDYTGGYPLLTRFLCGKIFESIPEKPFTVTVTEVKTAVDDFLESDVAVLEQLFDSLKPSQQKVVQELALQAPMIRKTLQEKAAFEDKGKDKNEVLSKALNYLRNVGLITSTKTGIRLKIGLLKEWLNPENDNQNS